MWGHTSPVHGRMMRPTTCENALFRHPHSFPRPWGIYLFSHSSLHIRPLFSESGRQDPSCAAGRNPGPRVRSPDVYPHESRVRGGEEGRRKERQRREIPPDPVCRIFESVGFVSDRPRPFSAGNSPGRSDDPCRIKVYSRTLKPPAWYRSSGRGSTG